MSLPTRVKTEYEEFRKGEPGKRFAEFNRRIRAESPGWVRPFYIGAAVVAFAVGVVLAFIPGPAVLFFALAAALVATQSRWLAERLDRAEVKLRHVIEARKHRERPGH